MKVVICDDSGTMRRIIVNSLNNMGIMDVIEAENGEDGYLKLKIHRDTSLMVLDWNMPVLNVYGALQKIKADPLIKHVPILMVTSESEKVSVVKAIQAGAANYLVKPFKPAHFEAKVKELLKLP